MIVLPENLLALANLASRESGRYSMSAVRVVEQKGDHYRCEATDGKMLGIVQGPSLDADSTPLRDHLKDAPNGTYTYLVPVELWQAAFKAIPRRWWNNKERKGVALKAAADDLRWAATGGTAGTGQQRDGRFPEVDHLFSKAVEVTRVIINPSLLINLLKTAAAFTKDGEERVELVFMGDGSPLGVMSNNGEQTFDGLIMPLS